MRLFQTYLIGKNDKPGRYSYTYELEMGVHIFGKSIKHNALVKVCILNVNSLLFRFNEKVDE